MIKDARQDDEVKGKGSRAPYRKSRERERERDRSRDCGRYGRSEVRKKEEPAQSLPYDRSKDHHSVSRLKDHDSAFHSEDPHSGSATSGAKPSTNPNHHHGEKKKPAGKSAAK